MAKRGSSPHSVQSFPECLCVRVVQRRQKLCARGIFTLFTRHHMPGLMWRVSEPRRLAHHSSVTPGLPRPLIVPTLPSLPPKMDIQFHTPNTVPPGGIGIVWTCDGLCHRAQNRAVHSLSSIDSLNRVGRARNGVSVSFPGPIPKASVCAFGPIDFQIPSDGDMSGKKTRTCRRRLR